MPAESQQPHENQPAMVRRDLRIEYVTALDMMKPFIKFLNFKNLSVALNDPPNKCFQDS